MEFGEFADMRGRQLDDEFVHPEAAAIDHDLVAIFLKRLEAHIVEHGQDVGQGNRPVGAGIELETEERRRIVRTLIGAQRDGIVLVQVRQLHRVDHGVGDVIAFLIADGEGARPGHPVDARGR